MDESADGSKQSVTVVLTHADNYVLNVRERAILSIANYVCPCFHCVVACCGTLLQSLFTSALPGLSGWTHAFSG